MTTTETLTLKVSSKSDPTRVAGAIAATIRQTTFAELKAIGAGAINQTVKSIAIARGFFAPTGLDLVCIPSFVDTVIDGEDRTAVVFRVETRPASR
jgi:stage V sporulation protein S